MRCPNPKCNLEGAYIRLGSKEVVCNKCGNIEPFNPDTADEFERKNYDPDSPETERDLKEE